MYCRTVWSTVLQFVLVDVVLGQPTVTYDHGKNCDEDLIMKCNFIGTFDGSAGRLWSYPNIGTSVIDGDTLFFPNKYTGNTSTSASNYFTMTIIGVTLSDATDGNYSCEYDFGRSNEVTLEFECYKDAGNSTVEITRDISKIVTMKVDRVFPESATLTVVTLTNSAGDAISGTVTSPASTTAGYADYFTLTWTSSVTVPDGTYTYTVEIQTNAAGIPVKIADNLSITFGGGGGGLGAGEIAGIACGCCVGAGAICAVTYVGVKQYKKSKKGNNGDDPEGKDRHRSGPRGKTGPGLGKPGPDLGKPGPDLNKNAVETDSTVSRRDIELQSKERSIDGVAHRPLPLLGKGKGIEQTRGISANFGNSGTIPDVDTKPRKLPPLGPGVGLVAGTGDGVEGQDSDRSERKKKKKKKKRHSDEDEDIV